MAHKKLERIMRTRRLTPQEVARDEDIRRKVQEEFPPVQPSSRTGPNCLSEALRKAIRQSGRSVYQIARQSDVSPIVISRFLSGERDIRMATADKLAETLGVSLGTR